MKQLTIIFIALSTSISSYCQQKDSSQKQATDSTLIFSANDYIQFYQEVVKKMPTEYGIQIMQWWMDRLKYSADKYNAALKKTKQ